MKKRLLVWMIGLCLVSAACARKEEAAPAPMGDTAGQAEEGGLEEGTGQAQDPSAKKPQEEGTTPKEKPKEKESQD